MNKLNQYSGNILIIKANPCILLENPNQVDQTHCSSGVHGLSDGSSIASKILYPH